MLTFHMRHLTTILQLCAVITLIGGASLALTRSDLSNVSRPTDAALEKGSGSLDGMTFTTLLAPKGKAGKIHDAMFFRDGQFLSLECEDRCNYPASAYFSRDVEGGQDFVVEAWCPTKNATMVWRGRITGDSVSGTVTWTVRRFYWTTGTVLEFSGNRASEAEVALWRP